MPGTPKPAAANGRPREDRIADGGYSSPNNSPLVSAQDILGWPAELIAEISAAPSRRVAAELISLSQDAIDALADGEREQLLQLLQHVIAELPVAELPHRLCGPFT